MKAKMMTRRKMIGCTALLAAMAAPLLAGEQRPASKSKFKIGAVDWELTKANDPKALAVAAKLGFDGLQVDLGDVVCMRDPKRRRMYLETARKHQIEIASLAMGVLSEKPFARNPKAQALVESAIDTAVAMKQKVVLLAFFGDNDLNHKENTIDGLAGRLKEVAPKAEKAGVILGIEGETSVEHYRNILDRVGSPAVQAYFDTVHAHGRDRSIFEEILLLEDKICEFHAKDLGHILFGQGKVDFRQVRRAMDTIAYRGWILVEQWGEVQGEKPLGFDETHRRNLKYLREIFD
jgi:sugar phosphate isomerase/epimerase